MQDIKCFVYYIISYYLPWPPVTNRRKYGHGPANRRCAKYLSLFQFSPVTMSVKFGPLDGRENIEDGIA